MAILSAFGPCSSGVRRGPRDRILFAFIDSKSMTVCSARQLPLVTVLELASMWRWASCWTSRFALATRVPYESSTELEFSLPGGKTSWASSALISSSPRVKSDVFRFSVAVAAGPVSRAILSSVGDAERLEGKQDEMVLLGEVTRMNVEDDQNSPQLNALRGLVGEGCRVSEIPCHSVDFYSW
jgi:hypothetical protein